MQSQVNQSRIYEMFMLLTLGGASKIFLMSGGIGFEKVLKSMNIEIEKRF